jgi:hypothetical protein
MLSRGRRVNFGVRGSAILMLAGLRKRRVVISGRAKRVIVYTASLLTAPLPVMPYVKGTREFALALVVCGAILSLGSFYVARGELKLEARGLLGNKLVASSLITLLFGIGMLVGAIIYLFRSEFA